MQDSIDIYQRILDKLGLESNRLEKIDIFSGLQQETSIERYQTKLRELYVERDRLNNQDLSEAWQRRKKGMSYWDSYGHDEICWNSRNLRKIGAEILFLEEAIPRLKEGLSIDSLTTELHRQLETYNAEDFGRSPLYAPRNQEIYQNNPQEMYDFKLKKI